MYTRESFLNDHFIWGNISGIHEIGKYIIVQYFAKNADGSYETEASFKPYVNGQDTHRSYDTLDNALIGALCASNGNTKADVFIIKMLRP